jgi:hypothetical protein
VVCGATFTHRLKLHNSRSNPDFLHYEKTRHRKMRGPRKTSRIREGEREGEIKKENRGCERGKRGHKWALRSWLEDFQDFVKVLNLDCNLQKDNLQDGNLKDCNLQEGNLQTDNLQDNSLQNGKKEDVENSVQQNVKTILVSVYFRKNTKQL